MATDDKHWNRLTECCEHYYKQQEPARDIHRFIVRHILGRYHPALWAREEAFETSIPLLSIAYRSMARHLISKAPKVLITPEDTEAHGTWAENREYSVNRRIKRSNLSIEFAKAIHQAMCSVGILFKCPMFVGRPNGKMLDLVIQSIDRSRYFYDTNASSLWNSDIQGHEFEVPLVDVREDPSFRMADKVEPDGMGRRPENEETNLRRDRSSADGSLYDYVTLRFVYEKRPNLIYIYPKHQPDIQLLCEPWLGPAHGPYSYWGFEYAPDHAEPIAPLAHLMFKHRSFNILDTRASWQQQASKWNLFYTSGNIETAKAVLGSDDLDSVLEENGPVRGMHIGGAAPDTVAMADRQRRDFSYAGINIDQLAGLSPQAGTLGQERLLNQSANAMMDDMAEWAMTFVTQEAQDLVFYDDRDPDPNPLPIRKRIPETDMNYTVYWTPQHRRIAMDMECEIAVEPYSYVARSPQGRLADLMGAIQLMLNFGDHMVAQGISIDVEGIFRTVAKLKNLPELYQCFILNQEPERLAQLVGGGGRNSRSDYDSGMPHRYIRESVSDGSGADMEMMRMFGKAADREVSAA